MATTGRIEALLEEARAPLEAAGLTMVADELARDAWDVAHAIHVVRTKLAADDVHGHHALRALFALGSALVEPEPARSVSVVVRLGEWHASKSDPLTHWVEWCLGAERGGAAAGSVKVPRWQAYPYGGDMIAGDCSSVAEGKAAVERAIGVSVAEPAPDEHRGVYRKFDVRRTDGSSAPGGKHAECSYFVLDLEHDPFAAPALRAYAAACHDTHRDLAQDIREVILARWGGSMSEALADKMARPTSPRVVPDVDPWPEPATAHPLDTVALRARVATLAASNVELREIVRGSRDVGTGAIRHVWQGACPDVLHEDRRDPGCRACQFLVRADKALGGGQ
jgi:hypothetical protein